MKRIILAQAGLIALAACGGNTADGTNGEAATEATQASVAAPATTETAAPMPSSPPSATTIPSAIQGRWGLVAADCEPGRDDAKGLLTITANKLEFYESVGTLDEIEEAGASRIRASFDFTGEGMTWEREVVLDVQDEGRALVRREYGDDAAPGPFRYSKCD